MRHLLAALAAGLCSAGCVIPEIDWTGRACESSCPAGWRCTVGACEPESSHYCQTRTGTTFCLDFDQGAADGWSTSFDTGGRGQVSLDGGLFQATVAATAVEGAGFARLQHPAISAPQGLQLDFDLRGWAADGGATVADLLCFDGPAASLRWGGAESTVELRMLGALARPVATVTPGTWRRLSLAWDGTSVSASAAQSQTVKADAACPSETYVVAFGLSVQSDKKDAAAVDLDNVAITVH